MDSLIAIRNPAKNFYRSSENDVVSDIDTNFLSLFNSLIQKTVVTVGTSTGADYVCDGVADNVEIQGAINAVSAVGGGTVFIRAGTYNLTAKVTTPSNIYILGEGWATLLKGAGGYTILENTNISTGNSNIILENFAVDGNNGSASTGNINLDNVNNVRVFKVKSINSPKEGIEVRRATSCIVSGCYINKTPTGAAGIIFSTDSLDCVMTGNTAVDTGGESFGIYYSRGCVISSNVGRIETSGRGHILVEGSEADPVIDNVIIGNKITSDYAGIATIAAQRISIQGNQITHFSANALNGISIEGASRYLTITGNTIYNAAQHGISFSSKTRKAICANNVIINPSWRCCINSYGDGSAGNLLV